MATFVVCMSCGKVYETAGPDQLPDRWRRTDAGLLCPGCSADEPVDDVLEEEVIYLSPNDIDTLDEGYCDVCRGPCQGH